ncbi:MAG: acyl-CoA dehydrogenase family protein [Rhizomicrobium sp.]
MSELDMDLNALRDSVRKVVQSELTSARLHKHVDDGALIDSALWQTAATLGWPALVVAEDQGGLGLGVGETSIVFEELGAALAPLPFLGAVLATRALQIGGSAAQQARWLPGIASGETLCALAEPKWDATAKPTLKREGAAIVLTGTAGDLLQGADAGLLIIRAYENGTDCFVVVEPKADHITLTLDQTVDRTRHLGRAVFYDLRLPTDRLLSASSPDRLGAILHAEASLALACESIGGAKAIFGRTIDYLKIREQFGRPIGSFQALKHRCADHEVALASSTAVVRESVRLYAEGAPSALMMVALAKAYACETFAKVAEDAVQLHGGIGFTWEQDCHLFLKRAKFNQALFGTSAAQLDYAADLLIAS